MLRLLALSALLLALAPAHAAPLTYTMTDRGVINLSDGQPLARTALSMHAPNWAPASIEQPGLAGRKGDNVQGSLQLPTGCHGTLDYSVTTASAEGGVQVLYTADFSEPNDIWGLYVSFMLPCARFEGKPATLLPAGLQKPLPRPKEDPGLNGTASAFAVDLGDGSALVIAADAASQVQVQDNRQYGASEYEVRFHLLGRGKIVPGMTARRAFRVAVVPLSQLAKAADEMNPKTTFDADKPFALLRSQGQITIGTREEHFVDAQLAMHGVGWSYGDQSGAAVQVSGDSRTRFISGTLPVPGADNRKLEFLEAASAEAESALGIKYHLHFPEAVKLNGYQVSFNLPLEKYVGSKLALQTPEGPREVTIPDKLGEKFLHSGPITRIAVAPDKPLGFSLSVNLPSNLLIQDNRGWGGNTIELRFNFRRQEQGEEVPAGETVERKFTFTLNSPLQIVLDESTATSETDTSAWVPYSLPWDRCPVDVSFLNDKPAGKHGFVAARDGKFVLSDTGEEIRFWGTCFSAGANFPTHEQAEKIAERLARFGVNIVRTHHADARWAERHFFRPNADNTREFDPESLDRFDYLLFCLKQQGIYIYLDQLVNRTFKPGDGVDAVDQLGACGKPYSNFDPRLIELHKEFSKNLWTHVNPYTKLAYKDDPAVAMMEFANENDLFAQQVTLEPYRTRFEAMYRDWAARNGVTLPAGKVNFQQKTDDLIRFLVEVQHNYYQEMSRFLREEVGVRVPMTGSNWSWNAALLAALRDMPYTDSHTYWNHPAGDGAVNNTPMLASRGTVFGGLAFQRMVGKPFFVSEWDEPWPNEWRAELPCWMAAIASFQQWNGLTTYTYRHSSAAPIDWLSGAFETFNDPARFGLFPTAALIFRRGDVSGAKQKTAVLITREQALSAGTPSPWGSPPFRALSELTRLDSALFTAPQGYDRTIGVLDDADEPPDIRAADNGQLWRSIKQKIAKVDSPRSQVIFGFLGGAGEQATADLAVTCRSPFATIALCSLAGAPIRESDHLLLTAVGRAENSGFKYNMLRTKKIAEGRGPILIDPIRATISIKTTRQDLKVRPIAPDGTRLAAIPAKWAEGKLTFQIGPEGKTMFYEVGK